MNPHLRCFKRIVAQVEEATGVNFRRMYGLRDLLAELGENPSPSEIVARGVIYLCREDGR